MDILPLGSVIRVCEREFIITGYRPIETNQEVALGYMILPFPLGYVKKESLLIYPAQKAEEVLFRGFESPRCTRFLHVLEGIGQVDSRANYREFIEFLKKAQKNLERQEGQ